MFSYIEPISLMKGPGPRYLMTYLSFKLKDTNLNFSHNIDTGLKVVVSNFDRDIMVNSEIIVFFAKMFFCNFIIHSYV